MKTIRCRLLSGIAILLCYAAHGEVLKKWEFAGVKTLRESGVRLFTGAHHSALALPEPNENGGGVLRLDISATPGDSRVSHKQLNCHFDGMLEAGRTYRIAFYVKGSAKGSITAVAALALPPYTVTASKTWEVTEQYQKAEFVFTPKTTVPGPVAVPRLFFGDYPEGTKLYIGDITFECLTPDLEYALTENFRMVPDPEMTCSPEAIPAEAKTVSLKGGRISFTEAGPVMLYQTVDAPEAGHMQVGMGADYYFECFVNGKSVYSTMKTGNTTTLFAPENHIFNLPLAKGKNRLAIRVKSGSKGFSFVCGKVQKVKGDPRIALLFQPQAGKDFRPVDPERFLEVKPGTALDFSCYNPYPAPAGSLGRVVIGQDGHTEFAERPGEAIRFFGFNWGISGLWRGQYHTWSHAEIDRYADAIRRRGYNVIRVHIPETFFKGWENWLKNRDKKIDPARMAQTREEIEALLDQGNMERFDYIVAAFKKRGIYIFLDLAGRHMINYASGEGHETSFKAYLFTDERYRRHYTAFIQSLMNRRNPYTGTAYKDEPALISVNFINEQDLRFADGLKFLTGKFRQYLKEKYRDDRALSRSWGGEFKLDAVPDITESNLRTGDNRARDTGDFLIGTLTEMSRFFENTLREVGYQGLTTHYDMIMRTLEIPARAQLPVISQHTYFDHPGKLPADDTPITKSVRPNSFVGNHHTNAVARQQSSLDSSYFRAAAAARFLDRPYFITEYSHCSPNRFRHERGLYFSSYAALQGWDFITVHDNAVGLHHDPFLRFDNQNDPLTITNEDITALIYLRGDVKTAPHSVELALKNENMFPENYLSAISDDYAKLALVTRLGVSYREGKPFSKVGEFKPSLTFEPKEFSYLLVSQWYVAASTDGAGLAPDLFARLRQAGILPRSNVSDPARGVYESETGEIKLDTAEKRFQVVTPRLEGAVLKKDEPVALKRLHIRSFSRPGAVTIAANDGVKSLEEADKLLLFVQTNAFNTGQIFNDREQRVCYESGNYPALIETVKLDAEFANGRSQTPEVYALHFNGERARKLPVSVKDGKLQLTIDTSLLQYGSSIFEISY